MFKKTAIALLAALFSGSIFAHGAWIAQQQDKYVVVYGHGAENNAYKAEQVKRIEGYKKGEKTILVRKDHDDFVSFDLAGSELVGVEFYNGFWTKFKDGKWEQKPRNEAKGDIELGTESAKYAVSLFDHHAKIKPLGYPLEIVPEQNPLEMSEGDSVTVKVLFNGKPLADAKVTNDYVNLGEDGYKKTDKDGKVTLTIRNDGLNVFEVGHRVDHPNKDKADKLSLSATFSFVLHEHKH
ncbi:hypothetical protein A6B43_03935 [Vespertiliibacter pulmonis]|uniref:Putative GH25 family protein n=1 Tax=Vespertiliibacter pulmonis TaxID=1443036 RepID=A0A3N4VII5_9PAST|nr:DUF4198 domain-containing protein [Vespertiliibacter pulmonis]QLB20733.1 hypothetical protein A6B43_03935 [Vespertiliibacter pulmonis]RPE82618.1 putative GH25 family protein [Vespertiliibacter pulmonis]